VIFTLPEGDLPQVLRQTHGGKTLAVEVLNDNKTQMLAKGKLITIDNLIDTVTGTVKLRAEFDNRNDALFPNQFVNTRLLVNTVDDLTIVPSSAIQHNGAIDFVYLIQNPDSKNAKAVMTTIKSGISDQGNTAVTGLKPGDVVANSSFQKLVDGSPVVESKVTIPATSAETTEAAP